MAAARRRRLSRWVGALGITTGLLAPTALASADEPVRTSGPAADDVTLTLTSVTPVVDATKDGAVARIDGRLRNDGSTTLVRPTVSVVLGDADMSRAGVADWAEGDNVLTGSPADTDVAASRLAPGDSVAFSLRVDADELLPGRSWGVAPVSVQAKESSVRTFLGVQRAKEYEPLRLLWGIPLVLPAQQQLWGAAGTRRTKAWQSAAGDGSDLARTAADAPGAGELWLLDPTLLSDGTTTDASSGSTDDTGTADGTQGERTVRRALADEIQQHLDPAKTVVLPSGDADVAAADAPGAIREVVRPQVRAGLDEADGLGARGDVAWPADGGLDPRSTAALGDLYGATPTVIVSRDALADAPDAIHAFQRSSDDAPLIVTDPVLGQLTATATDDSSALLARQRLVAETATILGELPGTSRTIAVLPERSALPDPESYAELRDAALRIPWVTPGSLADAETQEGAQPLQVQPIAPGSTGPMLTEHDARRLQQDGRTRRAVASVRSDGDTWSAALAETQAQLLSARWRGSDWHYHRLLVREHTSVTHLDDELQINSGDVNFFADTGRLQVTVENHSDVELHDLQVRLTPGSPILRIVNDPEPITIGPGSRRTVTVQADALAPGRVPVDIAVTDPSGRSLSPPAELRVRVSPTGSWIYWGVGAAALGLLALGTWRTVRRRPTS